MIRGGLSAIQDTAAMWGADVTLGELLGVVSIGLLVLGGASGVALFLRAVFGKIPHQNDTNTQALWALFTMGVIGGLLLSAARTFLPMR